MKIKYKQNSVVFIFSRNITRWRILVRHLAIPFFFRLIDDWVVPASPSLRTYMYYLYVRMFDVYEYTCRTSPTFG